MASLIVKGFQKRLGRLTMTAPRGLVVASARRHPGVRLRWIRCGITSPRRSAIGLRRDTPPPAAGRPVGHRTAGSPRGNAAGRAASCGRGWPGRRYGGRQDSSRPRPALLRPAGLPVEVALLGFGPERGVEVVAVRRQRLLTVGPLSQGGVGLVLGGDGLRG